MTAFQEISERVFALTEVEKLKLISSLLNQTHPVERTNSGIVKTADVCGGSARVENTRIPVRSIVEAKLMNLSDGRILESYPTLSARDIENALVYYARHRTEIEDELKEEAEL
ncbi:DUF433 domain-containing protein [Neolewinella sp.]|uniref:DUF433 domain-containing protein n=1 Tax=Neolewinella sp. TaxID=2993543 RepID=UPI003B524F71